MELAQATLLSDFMAFRDSSMELARLHPSMFSTTISKGVCILHTMGAANITKELIYDSKGRIHKLVTR